MQFRVSRDKRAPARAGLLAIVLITGLLAIVVTGCGGAADTGTGDPAGVVEVTGTIDSGDTKDPNHGELQYDAYSFDAVAGDAVVVNVAADGFVPLLKLVEAATGAVLAEWEAEYSDDEALSYTIAGPGTYEARVYALQDGSGAYTLSVRVNP